MGRELTKWISALSSRLWSGVIMGFLLGQTLGMHEMGYSNSFIFASGLLFVILCTSSMILLNHYVDQTPDRMKREMNENGSRYENFPSANSMLAMGLFFGMGSLGLLSLMAMHLSLWDILPMGLLGALLFSLYSFYPAKMNYRGGGEILELLGVGILLPFLSYYCYNPSFDFNSILPVILPFSFMVIGNTLAHSLVNQKSDKYGGKTTLVTVSGFKASRYFIEGSLLSFIFLLLGMKYFLDIPIPVYFVLFSGIATLYFFMNMKQIPPRISLSNKDSVNLYEFYMNSALLFGMGIVNFGIFYDYLVRP